MSALRIDVGFFPEFKGSDNIVLHGEPAALRLLAELFIELGQQGPSTRSLGQLPWIAEHSIRLQLCTGNTDEGMAGQAPNFVWLCKASTWYRFAEQLAGLAASEQGHVYLDTPNQQFGVVVTCNEYRNLFAHAKSAA